MSVSKEKKEEVEKLMESLGIFEKDLIEKFILGSGKGGQKINKTSSCVYLKHIPSGIEIKCQRDRSRELNRMYARRMLCEAYRGRILKELTEKQQLKEKIRRQKQTRSRKQKRKMLENKGKQSEKKENRRPISQDEP